MPDPQHVHYVCAACLDERRQSILPVKPGAIIQAPSAPSFINLPYSGDPVLFPVFVPARGVTTLMCGRHYIKLLDQFTEDEHEQRAPARPMTQPASPKTGSKP